MELIFLFFQIIIGFILLWLVIMIGMWKILMFIMKKQYIVLVIIFNLRKFGIDLDTFEE